MSPGGPRQVAAVIVVAAWVLFVSPRDVPLLFDSVGYASQALHLASGSGNTVSVGGELYPGPYPVGCPALLAIPMLFVADDVRVGVFSILACALGVVLFTLLIARRLGGPMAGLLAVLLLLSADGFRNAASNLHSQVPSALFAMAALLLVLDARRPGRLLAAGGVAGVSILIRYTNVAIPLGIGLVALCWGLPGARGRWRPLLWFAAGALPASALVLWHNQWSYGHPLLTGYDHWGWGIYSYSWRHMIWSPAGFSIGESWPFTISFLGLGSIYSLPVIAVGVLGLVLALRGYGVDPRGARAALLLGGLVATTYAVHAPYAFHSAAYLVPSIPLLCVLGGCGLARVMPSGWGQAVALIGAVALVTVRLVAAPGPSAIDRESTRSYESLRRAGPALEPDAVLLTAALPALVEPIILGPVGASPASGREVIYLDTYNSAPLSDLSSRTAGLPVVKPHRVATLVREHLLAGRPVYYHRSTPQFGVRERHREVHAVLVRRFDVDPSPVEGVSTVMWRDEDPDEDPDEDLEEDG